MHSRPAIYTYTSITCLYHDDVTPSQGSVDVNYVVEMRKAAATATVDTVRKAIVEDGGTFAGYPVDVNSITASGMFIFNIHQSSK